MISNTIARFLRTIPIVLLTLCWSLPATALDWEEAQKLLASDGAGDDEFGVSVALSGDVALVGAYGDDDRGSSSGSAYVFRFDGVQWVEEQKLLASDGAVGDWFGFSVALSGDVALVGANRDDDDGSDSGSAYVFRFDGVQWVEEQKLLASDGAAWDRFGNSVALSGDVALLGAPFDEDNGFQSGAAYIFRFDGTQWVEEQKLVASDGALEDLLGYSVALSGDVALVGASGDDDSGDLSGAAYVYRFNGVQWVEEQKLLASDGAQGDNFGHSVALSGGVALVGALRDDDSGSNSGSAYVFRFDGVQWVEEQKLLASDGAADDWFGFSVALSGDVALVGANRDDDDGDLSGAAYVYRFNGVQWVEEQKLLASDGAAGDQFGESVALSDDVVLVGAIFDNENGFFTGSAYVFETRCVLDLTAGYGGGFFGMNFHLGAAEPMQWNTWMYLFNFNLPFELWSIPLPVIDPAVDVPLVFPFPQVGPVLVLTWMETATPELCAFDWDIVDTGPP